MLARCIIITLCAAIVSCSKQPDGLSIGGALVTLGMSKEEAVGTLSREFELSRIQQSDVWLVSPKGTKADMFGSVGSLSFERNRLVGASRSRGKFKESEAVAFAKALHGLISELDRSGERIVAVKSASRQAEHGLGLFRSVTLQFTTRTIVVGVTENPDPYPRILIEEHIGWPKVEGD